MESRHQRRPLPTRSHIAAAKIGDDRDAGELRQQRRVIELPGEAALGAMADRLAVRADGSHLAGGESRPRQHRFHRVGIGTRQRH